MFFTSLFYRLPQSLVNVFRGWRILPHVCMIAFTFLIVHFGVDWWYFVAANHVLLQSLLFPAVVLGAFVPILGCLAIVLVGLIRGQKRTVNTAFALTQAGLLGLGLSFFYKAFTGRAPPLRSNYLIDNSHGFHFGLLRGGVFWGWPSSHTTVAFAMSVALIYLYPKNKKIKILALIYAFYIGFGISISIHWFSEFVAGAILGSLVGMVVGKAFAQRFQLTHEKPPIPV